MLSRKHNVCKSAHQFLRCKQSWHKNQQSQDNRSDWLSIDWLRLPIISSWTAIDWLRLQSQSKKSMILRLAIAIVYTTSKPWWWLCELGRTFVFSYHLFGPRIKGRLRPWFDKDKTQDHLHSNLLPSLKPDDHCNLAVGGAEPNRQKNESPLISMKFGDILGLVCVSMYKKFWRKNLTGKVLFWQKTLKKCRFWPFFTYKSTWSGDFSSLTRMTLILCMFYALYIHFLTLIGISGNILDLKGTFFINNFPNILGICCLQRVLFTMFMI